MDFRLGSAAVGVGPGADAGSTQPYFFYDFYTEVCRGQIEEGSGGAKAWWGCNAALALFRALFIPHKLNPVDP
jgi:hypothetical protein